MHQAPLKVQALPMPPYVPEPVRTHNPDAPPKEKYEYNFDIACSDDAFHRNVGCSFVLAQTTNEVLLGRWRETKIKEGTRYTLFTAFDEPKKLVGEVASKSLGLSPRQPVKVRPIGSGVAQEGFIPVFPAVQLGERLGFPTHGFYYHFHNGKLIQEYRILGDKNWGFYATHSMHHRLDPERGYNQNQNAILVLWKLGGKVVEGQHLVYLERQITRDELDNLSEEWLNEHGVKLDVPQLLEATKQPIIKRAESEKPAEPQPQPVKHIVQTDLETGMRETWMKIAKQYGLAPKALLELNPQYDADPMSLSVGDSLNVEKQQPLSIEKEPVYEIPPESPKRFNQPLNTFYGYTGHYLADTSIVSINNERLVEKDIAVVNLKKIEEKILRIGVFFDGTGQNHLNDLYKETRGVKSRTNVARLFEIYPLDDDTNKIYVAGVGTVDGAWQNPTLIDEGKDEVDLAQAFGVSPNNLEKTYTFIDTAYNLIADDTGAFYKWQNWTKQFYEIITDLIRQQKYQAITHIEFDVFGFSRGAALARHFVNAVKDGLPDYNKPRDGEAFGEVFPNLLAHQDDVSSQAKHG
ncbi:phospholipase effector Tle1 domain-containing protein, partial [Vibrio sp. M260112]|uniref:phospholipase effector Tle1 domain-containing protein n=1 Tax=Vibrio sp. M260112 TaxID=3020895 RepID=UPI002F3ED83C